MINLLKNHTKILIACFCITFFAGFGQTFMVAQFNPFMRETFDLDRTQMGFIYSLATFLASMMLAYLGRLLDRLHILKFSLGTLAFIVLSLIVLGLSQGVITIFLGFFLLRGFGQLTLGLIATTTINKFFGKHRGKAMTLSTLGFSLCQGIFPAFIVFMITVYGWRMGFFAMAILLVVVLLPIFLWLLPSFPQDILYEDHEEIKKVQGKNVILRDWTWGEVLRDKKVRVVMFANSIFPFVGTGLFFEQGSLAAAKGWSMELMATSFVVFSLVQVSGNFLWGHLIDHWSARRLQPFILIPLLIALMILYFGSGEASCVAYMGVLGLSMGLSALVRNAFWAEIYGPASLGRIKGMDGQIMVLSTSLAPFLYSFLLDQGLSILNLVSLLVVLSFLGFLAFLYIYWSYRPEKVAQEVSY